MTIWTNQKSWISICLKLTYKLVGHNYRVALLSTLDLTVLVDIAKFEIDLDYSKALFF